MGRSALAYSAYVWIQSWDDDDEDDNDDDVWPIWHDLGFRAAF